MSALRVTVMCHSCRSRWPSEHPHPMSKLIRDGHGNGCGHRTSIGGERIVPPSAQDIHRRQARDSKRAATERRREVVREADRRYRERHREELNRRARERRAAKKELAWLAA